MKLSRRSLLQAFAAGGGAMLVPMLRSSNALAEGAPIPKRVIFFYAGDGLLRGGWEPKAPAGASEPTETAFELGEVLSPIEEYKNQLIFFENLDMVSEKYDPKDAANAHVAGASHALTGNNRYDDVMPGQISIDQFIAKKLNEGGPVTALPSLEILCKAHGENADCSFASGAGEGVPFLKFPKDIYARLYPTPLDPSDLKAPARRAKVFSLIKEESAHLQQALSGGDREKLVQHLDAVSDLEKRLALATDRALFRPDPSIVDPAENLDWGYNSSKEIWAERWHVHTVINMKLAAAALHTDTTRVISIELDNPPGHAFGYTSGAFGTTDEHDLTHKVHNEESSLSTNPDAIALIRKESMLKIEKLKLLIDELAMRKEVDGSSLLEHTLIVFVSQIANGSHSKEKLPWFTVGGLGGYFKTGRYLRHGRTTDSEKSWVTYGRPHNDLFVSVANAVGVPIAKFGNEAICNGPIAEMRG